MTERENQVRTLIAELENTLRRCERQAKQERIALVIKGAAPEGLKPRREVELQPRPSDADLANRVTAEIEKIVARWEADSGQWVERLALVWRGDPPIRIPEDLHFRQTS